MTNPTASFTPYFAPGQLELFVRIVGILSAITISLAWVIASKMKRSRVFFANGLFGFLTLTVTGLSSLALNRYVAGVLYVPFPPPYIPGVEPSLVYQVNLLNSILLMIGTVFGIVTLFWASRVFRIRYFAYAAIILAVQPAAFYLLNYFPALLPSLLSFSVQIATDLLAIVAPILLFLSFLRISRSYANTIRTDSVDAIIRGAITSYFTRSPRT